MLPKKYTTRQKIPNKGFLVPTQKKTSQETLPYPKPDTGADGFVNAFFKVYLPIVPDADNNKNIGINRSSADEEIPPDKNNPNPAFLCQVEQWYT